MPVFICGAFKDMRSSCIERLCSNWLWHKQPKFNRPTQKLQWNRMYRSLWYINTVHVSLHQIQNTYFFLNNHAVQTLRTFITTLLISILHRIANKKLLTALNDISDLERKIAFLVQSIKTRMSGFCAMTKKKVYVLTSTFLWSVKATKVCSKWHKYPSWLMVLLL